jgi:hypothetical protein
METVEELTEQVLYRLSLDPRARELAVRLLERLHRVIGDLPASADHQHRAPGGLFQHSLEVAVKMLEEFEGHIIMERKPDGSVDSFQSARNRPRWQYASFLIALCHDLGKVFDVEVRCGEHRWFPLHQTYQNFARRAKQAPSIVWRQKRERGAHAALSALLLHHLLTPEDFDYLGLSRVVDLAESLAGTHGRNKVSPLARVVSKLDQASVQEAHVSMAQEADSKIGHFLRALQALIKSSKVGVNFAGGQVYVMGDRTAVVVPVAVNLARDYLKGQKIALPPNTCLYDMLRQARLVEADRAGHCVRKIKVAGKFGSIELSALIFPTDKVVPQEILPTLPPTQFEIEPEAEFETEAEKQRVGRNADLTRVAKC